MDELAQKWLDLAEGDLEAAETLFENPKSQRSYQIAVHHCHQAVEKLLKMMIVLTGREVAKIHDLSRLLELLDESLPGKLVDYIDELNPHYNVPRYLDLPSMGPSFTYDNKAARYHVEKSKELFIWVKKKYSI